MSTVKTGGTDRELGAVVLGRRYSAGTLTCYDAANRVVTELEGWPRATSAPLTYYGESRYGSHYPYPRLDFGNPQDNRGVFLPNGGCCYIDLGHPEICTPECRSADQYVASLEAMIAIVCDAMRRANARLEGGEEIALYVDNSDRQGNSYGAHLNVTITRTLWEEMFRSRMFPHLGFLASFQASSIALTGGGKVGSEDGAPAVDYQLSRRSDFIKTYVAEQTTYDRPMINARDEALGDEARLHCIFWDSVLFPAANYLQFGCLQLITALMEAGREWMPERLLLESPIETLHQWSRDPELSTTGRTLDGARVSILEHQEMMLDQVELFVASSDFEETVAGAAELVDYWRETLGFLQRGDQDRAARRIEWLAKRRVLESAMSSSGLDWAAPEIRQLDLCFGDLTPQRSLYHSLRAAGVVDELVNPSRVAHYKQHPPDDTRARARTTLIRQLGQENVVSVDWAEVRVRHGRQVYSVQLPRPDQPVVPLSDQTLMLVEATAQRYHSLRPYMNH